jgi:integrase
MGVAVSKPQKPSPDFPLFAHASGKWAKKINGRVKYFGRWADPQGALQEYRKLCESVKYPDDKSSITLATACDLFLDAKEKASNRGEIQTRTYQEYLKTLQRLCDFVGKSCPLHKVSQLDLNAFKIDRERTCGLVAIGNEVTRVRSLFRWLSDSKIISGPFTFGPEFKKPSARALRRSRRETGKKLFSREQIRVLLDESGIHFRAMILLGINCGFGNTDVATLPIGAVDLDSLLVDYPRPKTEVDRVCPLWPETLDAIQASLARRYSPRAGVENRLFVMVDGQGWDNPCNPIPKAFKQTLDRCKISRGGFYWLRHTFETIAGGSKDQVAVNAIMGHVDHSMAAVYREEIEFSRLLQVSNHVRAWLFS